jgi:DNA-binding LacI/PurR family transcriptional regulator
MIHIKTSLKKKKPTTREFGPTQKDIAEALGLAQSTVATALNPKTEDRLLAETAKQIKEYAEKVGYRPQRFAQLMRGGQSHTIGVVVRIGNYASNQELVSRLANELNHAGYRQVLVDTQWFGGNLEAVKHYLLDQAVEGVIFCNLLPCTEAEAVKDKLPDHLPLVSLSSGSLENTPGVRVDTHAVYHQLTRYHLELGSRHLACLSMFRDAGVISRPDWNTRERTTGFVQAIRERGGIVVADEIVQEILEIPAHTRVPASHQGIVGEIIYPEKTSRLTNACENGYCQTLRLIDRDEDFDSLVCGNDNAALGALAACADRGIRVPDDMRISGYGDTPAGQFAMVPLTTVRRPLAELARKAVEMILTLSRNPEKRLRTPFCSLSAEIVLRRSTASPEEHQQLSDQGFFAPKEGNIPFEFLPQTERLEQFGRDRAAPAPLENS